MISEILEMVKSWHAVAQFIFAIILVFSLGTITIALSGQISEFFNNTLTVWFRGYPPNNENNRKKEDDEDSLD
jgi:hypothetical protein